MSNQGQDGAPTDPFAILLEKLQSLDPESRATLRMVLAKELPGTDLDHKILEELSEEFRKKLAELALEVIALIEAKRKAAAKQVEPEPPASLDVQQAVPPRLTIEQIAQPVRDGLRESLVRANAQVRRKVDEAGRLPKEMALAIIDVPIRGYFELLGLKSYVVVEVKDWYGRQPTKKQQFIDNVFANLVSNAIWGLPAAITAAGAAAWAVLS